MEQVSTKEAVENRLKDMLDQFKSTPLAVTPESVTAFWEPAREAYSAYIGAMDAYDADLKERQTVLDRQGQALDAQIKDQEKKITALESQSREAASRGDLDGAATADEQAEDLRRQVTVARRKRRIASSTELRGDGGLYAAVQEKQAAYTETLDLCRQYVRKAVATVEEWKKQFEGLEQATRWAASRGPGDAGATEKRWLKIDKNFRREFWQKIEEQAAIQRAQAKVEQARREAVQSGRLNTF